MSASIAASPIFCPPASRKLVLAVAILASSTGFIDGSLVSVAMSAIRANIGAVAASDNALAAIAFLSAGFCFIATVVALWTIPGLTAESE